MKKQIISLIFIVVISTSVFAQSKEILSSDEIARIKYAVHLVTYDTVGKFDNAVGEAYYTIVISSFSENLTIPELTSSNITINDKTIIDEIIKHLNELKQNPPTWDELLKKQTQYLIWLDKTIRRSSKYRIAINP
jgi:hypothetical protein